MHTSAYKLFDHFKDQFDPGHLFVEIGSDRGGGSTQYLASLARTTGNDFITVDTDPILFGQNIQSVVMTGEKFVTDKLPSMGKLVNLVYLDNFDWTQSPVSVRRGDASADMYNLIKEYASTKGVELNNVNSSLAHLRQIKGLLPYMHEECVVLFENTTFNHITDSFVGKGGAAAYALMLEGFSVISASYKETYLLMGRNVAAPGLPNLNLDKLNRIHPDPKVRSDSVLYSNIS